MFYSYYTADQCEKANILQAYKVDGIKKNRAYYLGKVVDKDRNLFNLKKLGTYYFNLADDTTNLPDGKITSILNDIECKKKFYAVHKNLIEEDPCLKKMLYEHFASRYTYESVAIEGNPLSQSAIGLMLYNDCCLSPPAVPMRYIYEAVNHRNAFQFTINECLSGKRLEENIILKIHEILMRNIMEGGRYRECDICVKDAKHDFPTWNQIEDLLKTFYASIGYQEFKGPHPVVLAAWLHAEFVGIHPFLDGNGRTSRLIMNFELMKYGYWPISISLNKKEVYFSALDCYANSRNLVPLVELLAEMELESLNKANGVLASLVGKDTL